MIHVNIRSLPAHILELESYTELLCRKFTVIGITETWLTELNNSLYALEGYNHVGIQRHNRAGVASHFL